MLNSTDILSLATSPRTGAHRGKIQYKRQALQNPRSGDEASQGALLDSLLAQPVEGAMQGYEHPGASAVGGLAPQLSAADLAWVQRLPTDPEKISFEDARTLAGMAQATQLGSPDRRLVESVWAPVKAIHDVAAAKVELANASAGAVPTPPASTHSVLTAALQREMPMLAAHEAAARATVQLQDAVAKQTESRRQRRDAAAQKLAALRAGAT